MPAQAAAWQFVLCGTGDSLDAYRARARGCASVMLPGYIDETKIRTLMEMSHVGLAPYRSTRNFVGHVPNKVIEYLSAGLPIVSTLQGTLRSLLEFEGCGVTVPNDDAAALAAALARLSGRPDERARLAAASARLFEERFTAGRVLPAMTSWLETVSTSALGKALPRT